MCKLYLIHSNIWPNLIFVHIWIVVVTSYYFMPVCNNSCLNVLVFYCAIHDRCNILQGNTWLNKKSVICIQTNRQAHLSVLARCVCTRIFFVGLRSVLLSRACECSVCLHVARAHLTAWQRSGSQLQTVRTVALPQPPLHCSGSEGGASPNKCGEGKKTKTTNLKNVGHGAWPSSSWTTQRVWMWSTVIIPHARHGSRAGSSVCFSLCQAMFGVF